MNRTFTPILPVTPTTPTAKRHYWYGRLTFSHEQHASPLQHKQPVLDKALLPLTPPTQGESLYLQYKDTSPFYSHYRKSITYTRSPVHSSTSSTSLTNKLNEEESRLITLECRLKEIQKQVTASYATLQRIRHGSQRSRRKLNKTHQHRTDPCVPDPFLSKPFVCVSPVTTSASPRKRKESPESTFTSTVPSPVRRDDKDQHRHQHKHKHQHQHQHQHHQHQHRHQHRHQYAIRKIATLTSTPFPVSTLEDEIRRAEEKRLQPPCTPPVSSEQHLFSLIEQDIDPYPQKQEESKEDSIWADLLEAATQDSAKRVIEGDIWTFSGKHYLVHEQ
ncbi:hypothetical protein BDF14DRAFT_1841726 [Spinellus fusiger]|nr:hypothetical protein BDF14DRAFT_1841726 [Spinellus fusiger]